MEGKHILYKMYWYIKLYVYDTFRPITVTAWLVKHSNVNDYKIAHQDQKGCREFSWQICVTELLYLIFVECAYVVS